MSDSSRRAVEAADNLEQEYHLKMQVHYNPNPPNEDEGKDANTRPSHDQRPNVVFEDTGSYFNRGKRSRISYSAVEIPDPAAKHRQLRSSRTSRQRTISPEAPTERTPVATINGANKRKRSWGGSPQDSQAYKTIDVQNAATDVMDAEDTIVTPGLRHSRIRDLIQTTINESLKVGGRPDSAIAEETEGGEVIEVRSKTPDGVTKVKIIEWSVDSKIPEIILGMCLST